MLGKDRSSPTPPSPSGSSPDIASLLGFADRAMAEGRLQSAVYLYLAAFDAASKAPTGIYPPVVEGLRHAWDAACRLKDRSLAEHVFEKLEPYSTGEEIARNAEALQRIAIEKLEEFGFSREDLQDMANMVSEDFADALKSVHPLDAVITQVFSSEAKGAAPAKGVLPWPAAPSRPGKADEDEQDPYDVSYGNLAGFDRAIQAMNRRGVGLASDEGFKQLIADLSAGHGIDSVPYFETLVFRSPSREDAGQFMAATASEMAAPSVRMFMEETPLGIPVLCVVASSDFKPNMASRSTFEGPGVLMLEDIDLWGAPFSDELEEADGPAGFAALSRGAREAVSFIRSAVENPEVCVMATCNSDVDIDPFFYDLLYPSAAIEVELPDEAERKAVWEDAFSLYPSLRHHDVAELVRFSANMARAEIYVAAREAVEQAYVASVEKRAFVPVSRDTIYERIASFQPLDSAEYHALEDAMVQSLMDGIDDFDGLLKGTE